MNSRVERGMLSIFFVSSVCAAFQFTLNTAINSYVLSDSSVDSVFNTEQFLSAFTIALSSEMRMILLVKRFRLNHAQSIETRSSAIAKKVI